MYKRLNMICIVDIKLQTHEHPNIFIIGQKDHFDKSLLVKHPIVLYVAFQDVKGGGGKTRPYS